jgi:hypothetical protein
MGNMMSTSTPKGTAVGVEAVELVAELEILEPEAGVMEVMTVNTVMIECSGRRVMFAAGTLENIQLPIDDMQI